MGHYDDLWDEEIREENRQEMIRLTKGMTTLIENQDTEALRFLNKMYRNKEDIESIIRVFGLNLRK